MYQSNWLVRHFATWNFIG